MAQGHTRAGKRGEISSKNKASTDRINRLPPQQQKQTDPFLSTTSSDESADDADEIAETQKKRERELVDEIEQLKDKVQKMEKNQTNIPPPILSVVGQSNNVSEEISAVTSKSKARGLFDECTLKSMDVFKTHLHNKLKLFIKLHVYKSVKFGGYTGNEKRDIGICAMAINSGHLEIPEGVSSEQLTEYFKLKIPKMLNRLRHNSQTLARRNWIGKKYRS